jgi:isopenicillin-N N-acyltransferase like protein
MRVVVLEGSPRERGQAYGEEARELVREGAERWRGGLTSPEDAYLDELIDGTLFVETARRLTPELVEEVEGIAVGSGVDLRRLWALNLMDEDWWVRGRPNQRCTSFGVQPGPGQPAILGQNMDLRGMDGLLLLLDIRPDDGPRVLAPTSAGMVATNAFNEHGVGVCVNTLFQLPRSSDGLPVAFVIRALATRAGYDEAVALLKEIPHASGQNYIVGGPAGVGCFEASAEGVFEYAPGPRIGHTNHPLIAEARPDAEDTLATSANTGDRLTHIDRRLADADVVDVGAARQFLAESPLCRGGEGDLAGATTFYGMILEPEQRRMWLAGGPPDRNEFERYDLLVDAAV